MNKNSGSFLSQKRQAVYQSRLNNIKTHQMQQFGLEGGLADIIKFGIKSKGAMKYISRDMFLYKHDTSLKSETEDCVNSKIALNQSIVQGVEQVHEDYFVPQLQVPNKDSIDALLKLQRQSRTVAVKRNTQTQHESVHKYRSNHTISEYQDQERSVKVIPATIERMRSRVVTLPSRQNSSKNNIRSSNNKSTARFKDKSGQSNANRKRSNTYLFHLPTKLGPKKMIIYEEKTYPWEEGLMQVMNAMMGSNIKSKQNVKISRDRLAAYLNKFFLNQVITNYYNLEKAQHFDKMRSIVQDMQNLSKKQANIIAFFTYDTNSDGFICEQDLYQFLQKLPHTAPIMQDISTIIQFLRKNQVRSHSINIPRKILEKKQKTVVQQIWNDNSISQLKDFRPKEKQSLNVRFFSINHGEESHRENSGSRQSEKGKHVFKKFQINFDVFNLIFADRKPQLIPQMIRKLTEKPEGRKSTARRPQNRPTVKTEPTEDFLYTRSEQWKSNMGASEVLRSNAKLQRKGLSYKI